MPSFFQRMKFAWDYFVRGRNHIHSRGSTSVPAFDPEAFRASLDTHNDALVGEYVRTTIGTWWSDTTVGDLTYPIRVIAPGAEPTEAQMQIFAELVRHIPKLIDEADLEDAPSDDGWGCSPPPFDIHTARLQSIVLGADGGFFVLFNVDGRDAYMLCPSFTISSTYTLVEAEWSV